VPFTRHQSTWWGKVTQGPEDPILGITVAFNKDTHPKKINLGVGAYRDDNGKPYVLPSVREAEKRIFEAQADHEYTAIGGVPEFTKLAQELKLGADSPAIKEKRAVTIQALSGTGALRVGADFLKRWVNAPNGGNVYLSNPTWANHIPIFKDAGFNVPTYRYYNAATCGLDFAGMKEDMKNAPAGSLFLLHACAHNPTGVDPTQAEWNELSALCKEKKHFVFFDLAYQGFASGDPERDAYAVRRFIADGHNVMVAQSFAKNFGLYGERIGTLSVVCEDEKQKSAVESQLKILVRPMYSNPPVHGARIISTILKDASLTASWRKEVKLMADRIIGMRQSLVKNLKEKGSRRDWSHVTKQIGMFCYSGLTPEEVDRLAAEHHVYLTRNGRISIAGITSKNVEHLAQSIAEVTGRK